MASGVTRTSGATSRYSAKVVLISAEEFDLSLEGVDMHRERAGGGRARLVVGAQALRQGAAPNPGAAHAGQPRQMPQRCTPSALHCQHAAVKRQLLRAQYRLRLLVESSAFTAVFLGAILVNTVLLAIEHDGMSHE